MNYLNKKVTWILLCLTLLMSACSSITNQGKTNADSYTLKEAQKPLINYFISAYRCPKELLTFETKIKGPFLDMNTHEEIGTEEMWFVRGCGKSLGMRVIIEDRTWYGLQDYSINLQIGTDH